MAYNVTYSPNRDNPVVFNARTKTGGGNTSPWKVPGTNTPLAIVDDLGASTRKAVVWDPANGTATSQFVQGSAQGGNYTLTFRLRATSSPGSSTLTTFTHTGTGNVTSFTHPWDLSGLTSSWSTMSVSTDIFPSQGTAFFTNISGGFTGLYIDYFKITQNTAFADSLQMTYRSLTGWPTSPPGISPRNSVWHGRGFYWQNWKVDESLQSIPNTLISASKHYFDHDTRGFNTDSLTSAAVMASYGLLVLDNIDKATFSYQARDWLRGYVNAGGRVLMLGGPVSCGRGFWQESDTANLIFPVDFANSDLVKLSTPETVQTVSGPIFAGPLASPPVCLYAHALAPRSGSFVHMTVGGDPALVSRDYGAGRVAVCGLTPLGVPGSHDVWWLRSDWQSSVMDHVMNWMVA